VTTPTPERNPNLLGGKPTRRRFLETVGKVGFFGALGGIFASTMRFLLPNVLYEPPTTFTIGTIDDFPPDSVTFMEEDRLFVFRRPEGLYVISSVCTHLGCNVIWNAEKLEFDCPCHGSIFDKNGNVVHGPAPKPLKWYVLALVGDRKLQVNTRHTVNETFRFKV